MRPVMTFDTSNLTAVILAGGRARRMGGIDKGLIPVCGRPMIEHVLDALRDQAGTIIINANRNLDTYRALGHAVVPDSDESFAGPLAGMSGGLHAASTPLCLTVPCDSPLIGADVARRLYEALHASDADIAVAFDGERAHSVVNLMKTVLADSIDAFLVAGERKIDRWFDQHHWVHADFSDRPDYFINVNTEEERLALEQQMCPEGA